MGHDHTPSGLVGLFLEPDPSRLGFNSWAPLRIQSHEGGADPDGAHAGTWGGLTQDMKARMGPYADRLKAKMGPYAHSGIWHPFGL